MRTRQRSSRRSRKATQPRLHSSVALKTTRTGAPNIPWWLDDACTQNEKKENILFGPCTNAKVCPRQTTCAACMRGPVVPQLIITDDYYSTTLACPCVFYTVTDVHENEMEQHEMKKENEHTVCTS